MHVILITRISREKISSNLYQGYVIKPTTSPQYYKYKDNNIHGYDL